METDVCIFEKAGWENQPCTTTCKLLFYTLGRLSCVELNELNRQFKVEDDHRIPRNPGQDSQS